MKGIRRATNHSAQKPKKRTDSDTELDETKIPGARRNSSSQNRSGSTHNIRTNQSPGADGSPLHGAEKRAAAEAGGGSSAAEKCSIASGLGLDFLMSPFASCVCRVEREMRRRRRRIECVGGPVIAAIGFDIVHCSLAFVFLSFRLLFHFPWQLVVWSVFPRSNFF
jgi:hypothetical protein